MEECLEKITLDIKIKGLNDIDDYSKAELLIYEDKALLHVFFSKVDEISYILPSWDNGYIRFNWGKLVNCKNAIYNGKSINVDLSAAKLITYGGRSQDNIALFNLQVDFVQYSFEHKTGNNIAYFTLNDAGHDFIKNYYTLNYFTTNNINLPERKDIKSHNVLNSFCTPIFHFNYSDNKNKQEIHIAKVPKLKWTNFEDVETVMEYNSWICSLASLHCSQSINYKQGCIDYKNTRTIVWNYPHNQILKKDCAFLYLNGLHNIYDFFNTISFERFNARKKNIVSIIHRYLQSTLLSGATKYLLLYSILEQCQEKGEKAPCFNNLKSIKRKYEKEALDIVLSEVDDEEKNDFKNRWNSVWRNLREKPYKTTMNTFLEKNRFNIEKINIHIQEEIGDKTTFTKLRNDITHGSNVKIPDTINDILSFVDLILILRFLNCPIDITNVLGYSDIYRAN